MARPTYTELQLKQEEILCRRTGTTNRNSRHARRPEFTLEEILAGVPLRSRRRSPAADGRSRPCPGRMTHRLPRTGARSRDRYRPTTAGGRG
ncbi:MAG: hypothetical protein ACLRWQ_10400 [Flavonifractor plautii]